MSYGILHSSKTIFPNLANICFNNMRHKLFFSLLRPIGNITRSRCRGLNIISTIDSLQMQGHNHNHNHDNGSNEIDINIHHMSRRPFSFLASLNSSSYFCSNCRCGRNSSLFTSTFVKRYKYRGATDEEEQKDTEFDIDDEIMDDDDYNAPANFKQLQTTVKSLRADSVISSGLGISKNKADEAFYNSKLLINGIKLLKKSKQLDEGDYVDLITEVTEDILKVKRVKLMKIDGERTKNDRLRIILKVWKIAFDIEKPTKWQPPTDEK